MWNDIYLANTGVFAGQNIPAHTFIGIYSGEILTDADGAIRGE